MFNFENISAKIKILAKVLCWLGIGVSCIIGLYQMVNDMFIDGVIVVIVGSLTSWVSSFFMYGFGELIEQSTETTKNTKLLGQILENMNDILSKEEKSTKLLEENLKNLNENLLNENLSKNSEKEKRTEKETEPSFLDLAAIMLEGNKEKGKKTE